MTTDAKKAASAKKETAMGSALKDALAKSGGLRTVQTKPASKKKEKQMKPAVAPQPQEQNKDMIDNTQKVRKGEAPDTKKAITTVAKKIARKVVKNSDGRKPNGAQVSKVSIVPDPEAKPAENAKETKPYSPSVVKALKEQFTHELKSLIRKADDAGLLIHIPIVNGRPFVKFHDKATYKPKQPQPVKQEQQQKTA